MKKENIYIEKICVWFTTLGGIGFLPKAPGTWGSLAALAVLFIPVLYRTETIFVLIIIFTILGYFAIKPVEKKYGSDASVIVIDEVIGMWLTLASPYVPHNLLWVSIAFVLFRFFDIKKPFPISWINRQQGSFYVLFDDILAGIAASICLHILHTGYMLAPLVYYYFKNG
ncbi:MAG: phosphatidylglycerophosphatase [Ignavibacteria bacterium]|nr:phosphatidylglycerophosphatase [Ignavibacteria bacterium]